MVLWSVAGFSVPKQIAQRTHYLYMLMGRAARNAGVSIISIHLDQAERAGNVHNPIYENGKMLVERLQFHLKVSW